MSAPEHAEATFGPVGLEAHDVWPRYEHDPDLRRAADEALMEVTGLTSTARADQAATSAVAATAKLELTVTCVGSLHRGEWLRALGYVYSTANGALFLAADPDRWLPDDDGEADARTPTEDRLQVTKRWEQGDEPIPVTLVRVLLADPDPPARLRVKCRRHGRAFVNTAKLRTALGRVRPADAPDAPTRWVPLDQLSG